MDEYRHIVRCAVKAAKAGGKIIEQYYRRPVLNHQKEDHSPVTVADQKAEQRIRQIIIDAFPTHGIIGEEFGEENAGAEFVWVIDPLDGTKSFMAGRPTFAVLIGVLHHGKPVVGVMYQPILQELWIGSQDDVSLFNGKAIRTSACTEFAQAIIATTGPDYFSREQNEMYAVIASRSKFQLWGGDCYNYGLLAMGYVDLVIEAGMKLHDVAGLIPIIEGAGGIVTDWYGRSLQQGFNGTLVAASSGALHQKSLRMIQAML